MPGRVLTLDGPAGVGKSTLARRLAEELGLAYLDTGAMFRAAALALPAEAASWDEPRLRAALAGLHFSLSGAGADTVLSLNGRAVGHEIRTEEAAMAASTLAVLPAVRDRLRKAQQEMGRDTDLVAEGRDMGTVVFPHAWRKFFLDADPAERARRRVLQLREMGRDADFADILRRIEERDRQDRERPVAPLKPAQDAAVIDTTRLDVEGVFRAILERVRG